MTAGPAPPPAAPGPTTTPPVTTPAAGGPRTDPAARRALVTLLRRAAARLGRHSPRRLSRGLTLRVPASGVPAGRLTLRLERASGRPKQLALRTVSVRRGRTHVLRMRPGPKARTLLRRGYRRSVVLRATHTGPGFTRTTATRRLTLRP